YPTGADPRIACTRQESVTARAPADARGCGVFMRPTRTLAATALAVCVLLAGAALTGTPAPAAAAAQPEFGGQCALGLAEGHSIATDCSISWTARDGKLYCFSSERARKQFLEDPQGNIQRALDFSAAGAVQATGERMDAYKTEEVETFVSRAIADTAAHNNGVFPLVDPVTGTTLRLIYEKIDFTRTLHGYGFFPDVIFHAQEDAGKRYLVDFWVKPGADKLEIVDTRIRKAPRREGTAWTLQTRQPIPWWWIPASEHPGKTEQTRGWEVMSAVEESVVQRRDPKQGTMKLKDPVTGETLQLDFVGTHQPVRRLAQDGRYFACTDFRKAGTTDQFYDIDFRSEDRADARVGSDVGGGRERRAEARSEAGDHEAQGPRDRRDAPTGLRGYSPARASPGAGRSLLRVHGFPQGRHDRPVLRHRL